MIAMSSNILLLLFLINLVSGSCLAQAQTGTETTSAAQSFIEFLTNRPSFGNIYVAYAYPAQSRDTNYYHFRIRDDAFFGRHILNGKYTNDSMQLNDNGAGWWRGEYWALDVNTSNRKVLSTYTYTPSDTSSYAYTEAQRMRSMLDMYLSAGMSLAFAEGLQGLSVSRDGGQVTIFGSGGTSNVVEIVLTNGSPTAALFRREMGPADFASFRIEYRGFSSTNGYSFPMEFTVQQFLDGKAFDVLNLRILRVELGDGISDRVGDDYYPKAFLSTLKGVPHVIHTNGENFLVEGAKLTPMTIQTAARLSQPVDVRVERRRYVWVAFVLIAISLLFLWRAVKKQKLQ